MLDGDGVSHLHRFKYIVRYVPRDIHVCVCAMCTTKYVQIFHHHESCSVLRSCSGYQNILAFRLPPINRRAGGWWVDGVCFDRCKVMNMIIVFTRCHVLNCLLSFRIINLFSWAILPRNVCRTKNRSNNNHSRWGWRSNSHKMPNANRMDEWKPCVAVHFA